MTVIALFGGPSDERHVSVATAQNVARTLTDALCWFWTPGGAIHDVNPAELVAHPRPFENDFEPSRPAIWPDLEQALDTLPVEDPVFFLALHGGPGEDGTVQRMMERRGIPFTGSDSEASASAFDKGLAKAMAAKSGKVKVAESRTVMESDEPKIRDAAKSMLTVHERIVLKPLAAGSSRGLFFLDRAGDLERVVREIVSLQLPYIIEQFIHGRELTCGVIDTANGPVALPVVEIEVDPGFTFDYVGKYLGKGTREICPAKLPDDVTTAVQQTALESHRALHCAGYSRTDIMASKDGPYFLELNTLPGLTVSSLVPQELKAAGIEFRDFLAMQLELARKRDINPAARSVAG